MVPATVTIATRHAEEAAGPQSHGGGGEGGAHGENGDHDRVLDGEVSIGRRTAPPPGTTRRHAVTRKAAPTETVAVTWAKRSVAAGAAPLPAPCG